MPAFLNQINARPSIMKLLKKYAAFTPIMMFLGLVPSLLAQDSLSLSNALQKALENNYGLVISQAEASIAEINNYWGNAGRYPTIGFDLGSYNSYDVNNTANFSNNRVNAGLNLRWTLFDGFRVVATKDRLSQLEELAEGRTAVVVESTIEDVILAYYYVLLVTEELEVLENVMTLSKDRYDYEQIRYDLGSTASYNVLQAKNTYLNDKALFLNQEVVVRNAIRNLNFLMREDASETWLFTEPFEPGIQVYALGDLMDKMLANNQTLQNQYTNLMLSQTDVKLQRSAWYPSLDLSTGVTDNWAAVKRSGSDPSFGNNLNTYGNIILSYDIYAGGTRKRALEVARINEEISQVEIDQMEHSLTNQLMNVFDYYNVRQALLEVAEEGLEAAELNLEIAGDKFRTGAINSFNYRDIQLIYLNAAIRRLEAIFDLIDSRTSLTRITGGFINALPEKP